MIDKTQIFPLLLIFLDLAASVMYLGSDWRKVIYWLAAAALTTVVTF